MNNSRLKFPQVLKKYPAIYGTQSSIIILRRTLLLSLKELRESSLHFTSLFFGNQFNAIIVSSMSTSFNRNPFLKFLHQNTKCIFHPSFACHTPLSRSFPWFSQPNYINHESPPCAVLSSPLFLHPYSPNYLPVISHLNILDVLKRNFLKQSNFTV